MRWLFVFLAGILFGVAGVFALQRYVPGDTAIVVQQPPVATLPAPAAPRPSAATPVAPTPEPVPPVTVAPTTPFAAENSTPPTVTTTANGDALLMPIAGVRREQLHDSFHESRGDGRKHEAIDIMSPKGTPVLAVAEGKVVKLFHSKAGGLTVYQFDPSETRAYYYAHLDAYAPGLAEGKRLARGDLVGYVGSTGNANPAAPHLHFAIFQLGPEKQWWKGTAINPYPLLIDQ